jgi:non-ribosomal peptide synthetase component F
MRMPHIWEKSYPQGVSWDAPLPPPVPLESLLETAASKWPQRIALDFYDRTFTFRELHDLAARAAKGLQALGVGPGVHVGLHLPNTPHFVIGFFAVLMAGGRVVNFSPLAAPRELQYQIADSEAQVMITLGLPMLYPQIAALKGTGKFQTLVVCSIENFLPAPAARAFGPEADRVGGAGREIDLLHSSPMTAPTRVTGTGRSRTKSRCCNTPAARPASPRGPCSPTPTSAP